jgi:hypothetical protein
MGEDWEYNDRGRTMLSHEHGHNLQYQRLGFERFLWGIGIPSAFNAERQRNGLLTVPYYNQPWEIHADLLGGTLGAYGRTHTAEALLLGLAYFAHLESLQGMDLFNFIRNDLWAFMNHDFSILKEGS